MDLKDYRTIFIVSSLVLMLIAAAPVLGLIVQFPNGSEKFSELWLLGPNRMARDYPFNVRANESHSFFVGVGNHLGVSSYYLIYVKLRNQTQLLANATISDPSPLVPIYEFRAFVKDGGTWETRVTFSLSNVSLHGYLMSIRGIVINDKSLIVDAFSIWNFVQNGFYYQLLFELWLYDQASTSFIFNNRFVSIWLNVTTS